MSKHTPIPWEVDDPNAHLVAKRVNGVYEYICSCEPLDFSGFDRSTPEIDANAEFIVRACNSHYALLEACRAAEMFIRNGVALGYIQMPDKDVPDPAHKTPGMLRDAIAKAEGVI